MIGMWPPGEQTGRDSRLSHVTWPPTLHRDD